ncbi:MAG: universal stress protein [Deltaproteobacteria bacterium]|nr:universal stress protein [Deltaproteobacteria bacterium]
MGVQIQKILFATDLTNNSRHAFEYASSLAARYDARIVLFHTMTAVPTGARSQLDLLAGEGTTERLREGHREAAREILMGKKKDDHRIRTALAEFYGGATRPEAAFDTFEIVIREGEIDDEILKAASEFGCDLIVMGSHKGLFRPAAVGGKTKSVLHRAGIPVLVVPPPSS